MSYSPRVRMADPQRDAGGVCEIYAPMVAETVVTFELEPPDAEQMRHRMSETLTRLPWLVAEHGGGVAGYAYAGPHRGRPAYRWSVETSVYVMEHMRGRGVAGALYRTLLEMLAELGYATAFAGMTLPNQASVALHRALGFEPIGVFRRVGYKHGAWRDVGWWQRSLGEYPADPVDPIPANDR